MKKIVFLSFIIILFGKTQNLYTNESTFIVDNIIVEGKITKNSYREVYLETGFKKGFQNLILNLLKSKDQKNLLSTNLSEIESLIENYQITEESITDNTYKLKMKIKFNKRKITNFFYKNNISYSETTNLEILVYPIMILNSEFQVFSENNFLKGWKIKDEFNNINFILPFENLEDINFIKSNIETLEEINLDRLVDNYDIKNNTIVILRSDKKKLYAFLKANFQGTKKSKKIEFIVKDFDSEEGRESVINKLKFHINELWKEQNLIDVSTPAYISVVSKIKNPATIQNVKRKFDQINVIESYTVEELDKNNAKFKIRYLGKAKNLKNSLIKSGFKLKIQNNVWRIN
tara:strand:+ start:940 stop:1980 length:1041 start_codon:yes stop_codon:yes gene_type:complete